MSKKLNMLVLFIILFSASLNAQERLAPITTVEIGKNRECRVNGKPFFPIMSWAQAPDNFTMLRSHGINTFCGNQSGVSTLQQSEAASKAGGYAVGYFEKDAIGNQYLLAWIHHDEPDMTQRHTDVKVTPADHMVVQNEAPYFRLVDGSVEYKTVLQPLTGAEFSIDLPKVYTVNRIAVWQLIGEGMSSARELLFTGDGREQMRVTLENRDGRQVFDLPEPVTFKMLTVKVISVVSTGKDAGVFSEIEGLDSGGNNVFLAKPYYLPRTAPEKVTAVYREIIQADPSRPVMMTLTSNFMKSYAGRYSPEKQNELYPEYVKGADFPGFDTYPIYGWNYPNRLNDPAIGVRELKGLTASKKPVYAWIETHKGSKWVDYEVQLDVLPKHTRFEVWGAIIEGATAIGYFTHRWRPDFMEFAPTEDMRAELKRLNAQITRLAPAILSNPARANISMTMSENLECHYKATELDGKLYIFAQNIDLGKDADKLKQGQDITPRGGKASLKVSGLKAGTTIEVIDENRTLTAQNGMFRDEFAPLAEHIYMITMGD